MAFPDITFFPLEVKRSDTVIHFSGRNMTGCYNTCEITGMLGKGSKNPLRICIWEIQQQKYGKTDPDFISFLQSWYLIIRQRFSFYRRQSDEFANGHFHRIEFPYLVFDICLAETLDLTTLWQEVTFQTTNCFIIIGDC